jgi:hypothetical protein
VKKSARVCIYRHVHGLRSFCSYPPYSGRLMMVPSSLQPSELRVNVWDNNELLPVWLPSSSAYAATPFSLDQAILRLW